MEVALPRARSSVVERSAHNRLVVGSIPTEPRTVDVLTEDLTLREMYRNHK